MKYLTGILVTVALLNCSIECFLLDLLDAVYVRARHEDFYDRYLDVPGVRSRFNKQPLHGQVRDALMKLPLANSDGVNLPAEAILNQLKDAADKRGENESHRVIYRQLVSLSDEMNVNCPKDLLEMIKSIQAQTRAERKPFKNLINFMTQYAKRKLELCSKLIQTNLEKPQEDEGASAALDEFFRAAKSIKGEADDATMFTVLAQINLITSHFDVTEMGRVAKKHVGAEMPPLKQQPLTLMRRFLDEKCDRLELELGEVFDTINLAKALGSEQPLRAKVLKLNEIHRLCLMWKKDEAFCIIDNLHVQIDGVMPVLRPVPLASNKK